MSVDNEKKPAKAAAKPTKAAAPTSTPKKTATKAVAAPKTAAAPKTTAAPKTAAAPKAQAAEKSAVAAGVPEVAKRKPSHAEISSRAYFIYLERHSQHGHHENDWLRAERELLGL